MFSGRFYGYTPDALCAVGILAQFVQNPVVLAHWNALMRIIAYLKH